MTDQEIRKDGNGKIGNIPIVTFSTEELAEKAITGINKTNKYIAKKYEYETSSKVLLKIQKFKKYKKYNIYASYREEKTLNETEMRQIMEEYG